MEKITFKAREGSQVPKAKVQSYGEYLYALSQEVDKGILKPEIVVEKAREERCPIHDYFTWNNTEAGRLWRLEQARHLLNSILTVQVVYENRERKEEDIRAFHNIEVTYSDEKDRGYVTLTNVKRNINYLDYIIEQAHQELIAWSKKYKQYQNLKKFSKFGKVYKEIEEIVSAKPKQHKKLNKKEKETDLVLV